jgi:DNA-binding PadR family transcriptional regulator
MPCWEKSEGIWLKPRSVKFPRFRSRTSVDAFERFLMRRVERTLEVGLLFLIILKLLARKPMTGSDVRRAISNAGFSLPSQTTLYTHLGVMRAMKLIKSEKAGRGHQKMLHITEKGLAVLEHAETHLRGLVARLYHL